MLSITWNFLVCTDQSIKANKPDTVAKDPNNKIYLFIDIGIPCDYYISANEFDKLRKYKGLLMEKETM